MNRFDYIITGAGASGLMLAFRMAKDSYFDDKSILIIDQLKKTSNDRTWSFWEQGEGEWDAIVKQTWKKVFFGSDTYSKTIKISPYTYKTIRSVDFYESLWSVIDAKTNIKFIEERVLHIEDTENGAAVKTDQNNYEGKQVFNSVVLNPEYKTQKKYPLIQQHFVGWFIKTKQKAFDDDVATFMDFTVPQKGNTRFMYVLPITDRTALVEYTLFSKDRLEHSEYENEIKTYLTNKGITEYDIMEKEKGSIPMTSYNFYKHNTSHVLHIGTVGGWTKASTGYTFRNTVKKSKDLVEFIKHSDRLNTFSKRNKFWFYDLILLDVLAKDNAFGSQLFSSLFKNVDVTTIFKFLDEETRFSEDLNIILGMPKWKFFKTFVGRLFNL